MDFSAAKNAIIIATNFLKKKYSLKQWKSIIDDYERKDSINHIYTILDENGEEILNLSKEERWQKLLEEADKNLINEDKSASIIIASIRSIIARKRVNLMMQANYLSELENYRFQECHGGCYLF